MLLSSLLPSDQCVFAHITLAIELFALAPLWFRQVTLPHASPSLCNCSRVTPCWQVKSFAADLYYQCTWLLFLLAVCGLMPTSRLIAAAYISTVVLITFVFPAWLIALQKYKHTINGPWDEAVISAKLPVEH